jgi:CRISPR-associated exonuclease Cas4
MSFPAGWIVAGAGLALLLGLWLRQVGRGMRHRRGLGDGRTVALDNVTLTSMRLGLTGRPDRLVKTGGSMIPEEWKSSLVPRPWHRVQLGVYFLLIEEQLRMRPPYGVIVCGDGTRHRIDNTDELRSLVRALAEQVRAARRQANRPIPAEPVPGQCRPCGLRGHCGQARP